MPPITVSMIEEKDFTVAFRGYKKVEVDEFLDDICDEMIALQDEIGSLQARLTQAQRAPTQPYQPASVFQPQPAPFIPKQPEKAPAAEPSEAVQKMLANTQRVCDETLAEAKRQAEEIIREAKGKVIDPEIVDLEAHKQKLQEEIDALKLAATEYRKRFRALVDAQTRILEDNEAEL